MAEPMPDTVNFAPPAAVDTSMQVNFDAAPRNLLGSEEAQNRADKYAFATGEAPAELYQQMMAGQEMEIRKRAALREGIAADQSRLGILQDYAFARSKAAEATPGLRTTGMSQDELTTIDALSVPQTEAQAKKTDTILEELFAKKAVQTLYPEGNSSRQSAAEENLHVAMNIQDVVEQHAALNEYANRLLGDLNDGQAKKGFIPQATDVIGQIVPFLSQLNRHNAVQGAPSAFWTSEDLQKQFAFIRQQPTLKAQTEMLKQAVQLIAGHNQLDAIMFVSSFLHYGTTDAWMDNSINATDVASFLTGGAKFAVRAGTKAVAAVETGQQAARFAESSKSTVRALAAGPKPNLTNVAAAAGQFEMSAASEAFEASLNTIKATDPVHLGSGIRHTLTSLFNPVRALGVEKEFAVAREYVQNAVEKMMQNSTDFFKAVTGGLGQGTLSGKALQEAIALGQKKALEAMDHAHLSDTVIDIGKIMPEQTQGSVAYITVDLGMPGGLLFKSQEQASLWAREMGLPEVTIGKAKGPTSSTVRGATETVQDELGPSAVTLKQQGEGYYIRLTKPVRETETSVLDHRIETGNQTPQSSLTTWLDSKGISSVRTPSERLSGEQLGIRSGIMNRMSEVQRLIGATWTRAITPLTKRERDRSFRFFDFMRREEWVDAEGNRIKGVEFTSQSEFENRWLDTFKQLPTENEVSAYWGYIQLNQMQFYIDNLRAYSERARQGSFLWQFDKAGEWVEGRVVDDLPWDHPAARFMVVNEDGTTSTYNTSKWKNNAAFRERIDDMRKNYGFQVVQMADPRRKGEAPVHFVVTSTAQQKLLPFDLIPYKGGGHIVYDYPGFIKQAVTHKGADGYLYHYGDNTILPVTTQAESKRLIDMLEQARELYVKGDRAAFDKLVDLHPPFTAKGLWDKFVNKTINSENPFVYTRSGESTFKTARMQQHIGDASLADSWANSDLNYLKGLNKQFMGRRGWDVNAIEEMADEGTPLFEFVKPRLIDPMTTLSHSLNQSIRNKFFGQYQIRSAEHFVEEFHSVMQNGSTAAELKRLRENPMRALHNPNWDKNAANKDLLAAGRSYQDAALNLVGTQTDSGRWTQWVESKLMDRVYNTFGKKAADFTYEKLLPAISNPVGFARQVAFHTKLGMFNPVQLVLQAQTFTLAIGIAGVKHGGAGVSGAILARMLHVADKPENIAHFSKIASKLGWKAEHFTEAYDEMIKAGVFNIGSQLAWRWDAADMNFFRSTAGKWFDKGLFFFNEGERFNHLTGYLAAYHEWRDVNPFVKMTDEARTQIMRRYDDMTGNMTHASSSALNRGLGSVAGQFLSYQERMLELLLGKRLKPVEKLRVFAVMAAMYGVPTAMGAWTFGGGEQFVAKGLAPLLSSMGINIPPEMTVGTFYDDMRAEAVKRGVDANPFIEALTEGIPSLLLRVATGTSYNVGQRLGPGSSNLWDELLKDPSLAALLLGPSGNIMADIIRSTMPVVGDLAHIVAGQGVNKITVPDALSALTNISTISNGMKAFYALQLGKYMSRNQELVDNKVTGIDGLMAGLLGLTPNRIADAQLMDQARKAATDAQAYARGEAKKFLRMWQRTSDPAAKNEFANRINQWFEMGGFDPSERSKIAAEALTESETKVDAAKRAFNKQFQGE